MKYYGVPGYVWERDFSRSIEGSLDQGLTEGLSAALDSLLSHYPAASVAVALPGDGIWYGARGVAQVGLCTPVAKWLPNVPNADAITVANLLNHADGLVNFNALPDGRALGAAYRAPEELVEIASDYEPYFCPGALWSYTNMGYVMLGPIVEAIEGKPFGKVVAERILDPLGLNHSGGIMGFNAVVAYLA